MPLIDTSKTWDDYLVGLHQDMLVNFLSVHDEVVVLVDKHLAQSIMTNCVKIAQLDKIFDKVGVPYITFKFDIEYDEWGSYTAHKQFDVYKYSLLQQQMLSNGFISSVVEGDTVSTDGEKTVPDENLTMEASADDGESVLDNENKVIEVVLPVYDDDIIQKLISVPDGTTTLIVTVEGLSFTYSRKVDYQSVVALKKLYNLS